MRPKNRFEGKVRTPNASEGPCVHRNPAIFIDRACWRLHSAAGYQAEEWEDRMARGSG